MKSYFTCPCCLRMLEIEAQEEVKSVSLVKVGADESNSMRREEANPQNLV